MEFERSRQLSVIANNIRKSVLTATHNASSGHPGGSLSIADLLAYLYFEIMNVDPKNPHDPLRDRLVLSKGHCSPALYGVLAERGFFSKDLIPTFRNINSILQGHPDMKEIPGVDMSTGSLGQGISAAAGMALAAKLDNKAYRVYAILGDGELQEGQVWEAAMFAAHYKLDNLIAFVDNNGLQIDGAISDVMSPLPIDQKFRAFGWNVICAPAHDFQQLESACQAAVSTQNSPCVVVLQSTKGKNVSFMENKAEWHGSAPNKEQYDIGIAQLDKLIEEASANG